MKIMDASGMERDWSWLTAEFGLRPEHVMQGTNWRVTEIREGGTEAACIVTAPVGTVVTWGWPGGYAEGVVEPKGEIGFAMTRDAYYVPPAVGPHYVQIEDCRVDGLGMIAATEHRHLNVTLWPLDAPPDPFDGVEIWDWEGEERDGSWLRQQYGDVELVRHAAEEAYRLVAIRAEAGNENPGQMLVSVVEAGGEPAAGARVQLAEIGTNNCVELLTDETGLVVFDIGTAHIYSVPGRGLFGVGVKGAPSDGLAWIGRVLVRGKENPDKWLSCRFQWGQSDTEPPPPPPPPPDWKAVVYGKLDEAAGLLVEWQALMDEIRELVEGA